MIYDEELFCYPFLISQVGAMQNVFILSPEFLLRSKDEFSSLLYTEVESKRIRTSFFRMARYGSFVAFIYYWATTKKELNTGRGGLFVISGLLFRAKDFKKKWKHICYYIGLIYNLVHKMNDKDTKVVNGQIIFEKDFLEDSIKASELKDEFQDQYCDNLWDMIQGNDECIGEYIFANYQESDKSYHIEDKMLCHFFISRDVVIFKQVRFLWSHILQKLINICAYMCKQVHFFKNGNQLSWHNNRDSFWSEIMLLIENYSTEKSLGVFLQETHQFFRKNRFLFDISTVQGLTPYTAIFIKSIEQIPFKAKKIKNCKSNEVRYIKFFL